MRAAPAGARNHVGFQRVAVKGGQSRRTGSVAHDPNRNCLTLLANAYDPEWVYMFFW
jgi:hypothetical protein